MRIKKGSEVRIIEVRSAFDAEMIGTLWTVAAMRSKGTQVDLVRTVEGKTETRLQYDVAYVAPEENVTQEVLDELEARRVAAVAARETRREEFNRERFNQRVQHLLHARKADQALPVKGAVHERVLGDTTYIEYDPFNAQRMERERVSVSVRQNEYPALPEVSVNWSAIGSVTPEQALLFGRTIVRAAERALLERAALEHNIAALQEAE